MRLTTWGIGRCGSDALGLDLVGMGCRSMGYQEALGRGSLLENQAGIMADTRLGVGNPALVIGARGSENGLK